MICGWTSFSPSHLMHLHSTRISLYSNLHYQVEESAFSIMDLISVYMPIPGRKQKRKHVCIGFSEATSLNEEAAQSVRAHSFANGVLLESNVKRQKIKLL